jgi:hypothetical protein
MSFIASWAEVSLITVLALGVTEIEKTANFSRDGTASWKLVLILLLVVLFLLLAKERKYQFLLLPGIIRLL